LENDVGRAYAAITIAFAAEGILSRVLSTSKDSAERVSKEQSSGGGKVALEPALAGF